MKTAISVPDETFEQSTRRASALGMSRSEFFTVAAQRYLAQLEDEELVGQIDAALEVLDDDETTRLAVDVGRARLDSDDEAW